MNTSIEELTLNCPNHGERKWQGDVFCKHCSTIYLCSGSSVETTCTCGSEEFLTISPPACAKCGREPKKKFIYPESPPKGVCSCGKRLFGGMDFTARPMCHLCAIAVATRKANEEGKVLWMKNPHGGSEGEDYADPKGDRSYELWTHKKSTDDTWIWEVGWPNGHCAGEVPTREAGQKIAASVYRAVLLEEEIIAKAKVG